MATAEDQEYMTDGQQIKTYLITIWWKGGLSQLTNQLSWHKYV